MAHGTFGTERAVSGRRTTISPRDSAVDASQCVTGDTRTAQSFGETGSTAESNQ
jgi:hypothetical protein